MTPEALLAVTREALFLLVLVIAPPVGASLVAGLGVSILQTATQIQEQTVGFAVRAAAVIASLVIAGPWIGDQITVFSDAVIAMIQEVQL